MNDNSETPSRPLGPWGWITIVVLAGLLIAVVVYAVHAWGMLGGTNVSPMGWTFLILGVVVTVAVGAGLMALLFYSRRHHYDR
jgi:hypothetical protein